MNRIAMGLALVVALMAWGCKSGSADVEKVEPVSAADLKGTTVTSHLEAPLEGDKNVLWCATFQMAWNEICIATGGEVHFADGDPPMVAPLNKRAVTKAVLDEPSYVATSGLIGDGVVERIRDEMARKFPRGIGTPLLDQAGGLPADHWLAYAYLLKDLPFEYEFLKYDRAFTFGGRWVKSFGLYDRDYPHERLREIARQVKVLDVAPLAWTEDDDSEPDPDNFIIELVTKAQEDRLILAKVPPEKTLGETVAAVRKRVADAEPQSLWSDDTLRIPSLDFDLTKLYDELDGKRMAVGNPAFDERSIVMAAQRIRFRLNEAGALLRSEAAVAMDAKALRLSRYIFDKPFLILLQRKGATNPYFALWVGNAELLVPFE